MKSNKLYISLLLTLLILDVYIYKTHIIYYYYDKKYSKVLEEKYSKIYEKKYSKIYNRKYSRIYKEKLEQSSKGYKLSQCVKNKVPKVSGLLETAQYLRYSNNSFVRFGDGEMDLMEMIDRPVQKADKELARRLREVFESNIPSLSIAILNIVSECFSMSFAQYDYYNTKRQYEEWILKNANYSRQYFDAHITSPFIVTYKTTCERVDLLYNELREIWRDKDIVILRGDNGEKYDFDVFDTARSQKVYYGKSREAWDNYEEFKKILMKEDKDKLFILAIGPTSKVLVYDLVKDGRKALDTGHLAKDYNCFKNGKYDQSFYKP